MYAEVGMTAAATACELARLESKSSEIAPSTLVTRSHDRERRVRGNRSMDLCCA